jgi:hypothetical protein
VDSLANIEILFTCDGTSFPARELSFVVQLLNLYSIEHDSNIKSYIIYVILYYT